MSLRIDRKGQVIIRTPVHTSAKDIEEFFDRSTEWIARKRAEQQSIQRVCKQKIFVTGEEFLFLGQSYPLRYGETNGKTPYLSFSADGFSLPSNHAAKARHLFIAWYKRMAWEKITERVAELSGRLKIVPREMRLMTARVQWGSCSPDNRLTFNWKLVMAAEIFIDYVVAHELLHIREKNHSRRFWGALESFMPDYRQRKAWLDENGHLLTI